MNIRCWLVMFQTVCYAYRQNLVLPFRRSYCKIHTIKSTAILSLSSVRLTTSSAQTASANTDQPIELNRVQYPLYLECQNAHPSDKFLTFDEKMHKYAFNHKPLLHSVTSVVSSYFEKFEPNKAVELMMNGNNWPRPQYSEEDGTPFTKEKILAQWESGSALARSEGTLMHSDIELYLNNMEVQKIIPEFAQFLKFKKDIIEGRGVSPYRTEWRVAAPDLSLGGSVDFVGRKADGSYVLMDWKRSKNLTNSMYASYGKRCAKPLSNLPDCEGSKYGLQLNMYRYILGKYYGIEVSSMTLASFHPTLEKYFTAEIPTMDKEILVIVDELTKKQA